MHTDTWKNPIVFEKQLILNLKELDSYPQHWIDFIDLISSINTKKISSILDIGCGCGTYYHLCKTHFLNITYTGIDYSNDAVEIAKKQWKYDKFFEYDFWSLTPNYLSEFDIIHCGALLDVLPNADTALEKLLSMQPKNILLGRVKVTNKDSHFTQYTAYDAIETYAYYHNIGGLRKLFNKYNYSILNQINDSYLISKNEY